MSLYELPTEDPLQKIECGWDAERGSYWARVWDAGDLRRPISQHGTEGWVTNPYDLLSLVWGYIDKEELPRHAAVIARLRDDPWCEAAGADPLRPQLAELLATATE